MGNSNDQFQGNGSRAEAGQLGFGHETQPSPLARMTANATSDTVESWQILNEIIPRGKRKTVAYHMHVSEEWVSRWCREPRPGDNGSTGSPIDRTCQLHDAIFLINPIGSLWIPEYVSHHHRQLVKAHEAAGFADSQQRRDTAADLLKRATDAVNSLNLATPTPETLRQVCELIEVCGKAKEKIQDGLS